MEWGEGGTYISRQLSERRRRSGPDKDTSGAVVGLCALEGSTERRRGEKGEEERALVERLRSDDSYVHGFFDSKEVDGFVYGRVP